MSAYTDSRRWCPPRIPPGSGCRTWDTEPAGLGPLASATMPRIAPLTQCPSVSLHVMLRHRSPRIKDVLFEPLEDVSQSTRAQTITFFRVFMSSPLLMLCFTADPPARHTRQSHPTGTRHPGSRDME